MIPISLENTIFIEGFYQDQTSLHATQVAWWMNDSNDLTHFFIKFTRALGRRESISDDCKMIEMHCVDLVYIKAEFLKFKTLS